MELLKQISQNGITWTFSENKPVGKYANGEWWVVGPVTIVSISPADSSPADSVDMHGSMVNPTRDRQGIDSRSKGDRYVRDLNIARKLPYSAQAGESIMSGLSHDAFNDGYLSKVAVLTVVSAEPEAGSFRPNWYGSKKFHLNEKSLNYSVLPKLAPTTNSLAPTSLENKDMKHILIDLHTGGASANSEFKANSLTPHYGREISKASSQAVLSLLLNYPDSAKRNLLVEVVQRGIDLFGQIENGYVFTPEGGHNHGRKICMYVAAKVLGSAAMMAKCDATKYQVFQEDGQHDFVKPTWVNFPSSMYGTPEWTGQAFIRLDRPTPEWENTGYRFINGGGNLGVVLAVLLLGGRKEWNHEAYFRYILERYWPNEKNSSKRGIGSVNGIPRFTHEMYVKYLDLALSTPQAGGGVVVPPTEPPVEPPVVVEPVKTWFDNAISPSWNGNVSFTVVPKLLNGEALISLTDDNAVTSFEDMAAIIRFNKLGFIDARNGDVYQALADVNYTEGSSYSVEVSCDIVSETYSAKVNGVTIAQGFKFRAGRLKVNEIDNLAVYGPSVVNNITQYTVVTPPPIEPPVSDEVNVLKARILVLETALADLNNKNLLIKSQIEAILANLA